MRKQIFTFDKAGDYEVYVEVKDDKGAVAKSETKAIYAGNETPEVSFTSLPNANIGDGIFVVAACWPSSGMMRCAGA